MKQRLTWGGSYKGNVTKNPVAQYAISWIVDLNDKRIDGAREPITTDKTANSRAMCVVKRAVVPLERSMIYLTVAKAACRYHAAPEKWKNLRTLDHCIKTDASLHVWQRCLWFNSRSHCATVASTLRDVPCSDLKITERQMLGIN